MDDTVHIAEVSMVLNSWNVIELEFPEDNASAEVQKMDLELSVSHNLITCVVISDRKGITGFQGK
jgi:hypothetical protein